MKLKEDVGYHEPVYNTVYLDLHEDGTTTWRPLEREKVRPGDQTTSFEGERVPAVGWA